MKPAELSIGEFYEKCHSISPQIFELVRAADGSISAEHGVGTLKRDYLGYSRAPEQIELMRGLKGLFDPDNVMNPGKLLA